MADKSNHELEKKLLILAANCTFTEDESIRFKELICSDLDWGYILINVLHNRIGCMLYSHIIENKCVSYIQDRIYLILRSYYSYFKRRHILTRNELNKLVCVLNDSEIPYVLLKGIALCDRAYPGEKIYYRECGDFDFLIKESDVSRFKKVIQEEGYALGDFDIYNGKLKKVSRHEELFLKLYSHQMHEYNKTYWEDELIGNRGSFTIDINLSILEAGENDIDVEMLLKSRERDDAGSYFALCPEWFFIQICVHLYRDIESKVHKAKYENVTLAKFCDVNEYLKNNYDKIDWHRVQQLCDENCIINDICEVLQFLYKLFHTNESKNVLKSFGLECNELFSEIDRKLYNAMFSNSYNRSSYTDNTYEFMQNEISNIEVKE